MTDTVTNKTRATWVMEALKRFNEVSPCGMSWDREGVEILAGDLMADIYHLLAQEGIDPWSVVERAEGHFNTERDDER